MTTGHSATGDWLATNRANWDARVPVHVGTPLYDVETFAAGRETLRPHEADELGPVDGRTLVHLQCHVGLDTLSWARRGATVTGVDFSEPAVAVAAANARRVGADTARFVTADVYDAPEALAGETFDIVYVSVGSLQYLPDLPRWAEVVAALLTTRGVCYLTEFHPFCQLVEEDCRTLRPGYYRNGPIVKDESTYADPAAPLSHSTSVEWTHPPLEVVSALGAAGLRVEFVHEYFWFWAPLLPGLVPAGDGRWVFPPDRPQLPLMYSLRATKDVEHSAGPAARQHPLQQPVAAHRGVPDDRDDV